MRASHADAIDPLIARNSRRQRLRKGLSQTELGNAIGVTFQQVQKYETGANRISAARLFRIARALEVPIGTLYDAVPDETQQVAQAQAATPPPLKTQRQAARLINAFSRITDTRLRARLVELIERIAPP